MQSSWVLLYSNRKYLIISEKERLLHENSKDTNYKIYRLFPLNFLEFMYYMNSRYIIICFLFLKNCYCASCNNEN